MPRTTPTLCNVSRPFSGLVAALLESESSLRRGRFREETFTDLFVGALVPFVGDELEIAYPVEHKTGGDLDLVFESVRDGARLSIRLQAKRLSAATEKGKSVKFDDRFYSQLLHRVPNNMSGKKEYQYKILTQSQAKPLPLYAFYNHQGACDDPSNVTGSGGAKYPLQGVNLAFAEQIARELDRKGSRPSPRRMTSLRHHFFPLSVMLCPARAKLSNSKTPHPYDVALQLAEEWPSSLDVAFEPDALIERWLERVPKEFQFKELARGVVAREDLERPQIIFRSTGAADGKRNPV